MATIPDDLTFADWASFSKDGRVVAYLAAKGPSQVVIVGEHRSEPFIQFNKFVMSNDGKSFAYDIFTENNVFLIVTDKKRIETILNFPYDIFSPSNPVLSADGSRFGYMAQINNSLYVIMIDNERIGPIQGSLSSLDMSEDGKILVYTKWPGTVVVDGQEGENFDTVSFISLSGDGRVVAYSASKGGESFVVIGDKKSEAFENVGNPVISKDGKTIAYQATQGSLSFVVVGEKKGKPFDRILEPIALSPDGKFVAYAAEKDKKWFIVVNDRPIEVSSNIERIAVDSSGNVAYTEKQKNGKYLVVFNNKSGELFDYVAQPIFSDDQKKMGYGALKDNQFWWKVVSVDSQ